MLVNDRPVTKLGTKIDPVTDRVALGTKPITAQQKVYVALHKPPGVLCTSRDTQRRKRVCDLLPASMPRLFTVGRLDKDTEGLLFLTNDGNFSLRLTHPRYKMPKTYLVDVEGQLRSAEIARLLKGVSSDGETLNADKICQVRPRGETTELRIVLTQGKNRQIRRMMAAVGHPVRRLTRLAVGSIGLGGLKSGEWRHLTHEEIGKLLQFSHATFQR